MSANDECIPADRTISMAWATLDVMEKLNAMGATIGKIRQLLDVLEIEQSEILERCKNEVCVSVTADKARMVVNKGRKRDVTTQVPQSQVIIGMSFGGEQVSNPIRTSSREQIREPMNREGERDDRSTQSLKAERRGHPDWVQKSASRLSLKRGLQVQSISRSLLPGTPFPLGVSGVRGSVAPPVVDHASSLDLVEVSRSHSRAAYEAQSGGNIGPAQRHMEKPRLLQQILIRHPPRPHIRSLFPQDTELSSYPSELKRGGHDWFVLFNSSPKVKRVLDVQLAHTLIHQSPVYCVKFSPDGKWLATGCNRTAQIYDVKMGVKTCILDHTDDAMYVRSVCFSPDMKYLATGAEDMQIRVWNIAEKKIHIIFEGHQRGVRALHFTSNGQFIVSGSCDKTVRIWNVNEGTSRVLKIDDHYLSPTINHGVASIALSPDERYIAVGDLHAAVSIWDVTTGSLVQRLRGHCDSVSCVTFTHDGKGLMSGSLDTTLKYWDVSGLGIRSGAGTAPTSTSNTSPSLCVMNLTGHKKYVSSIAISHDCTWVVSGSDEKVLFWDARTGVLQCTLSGHQDPVFQLDFSPMGKLLATASGDTQARIWSYGLVGYRS